MIDRNRGRYAFYGVDLWPVLPVEELPVASWRTTLGLGFISAVFDNIPLTALALKMPMAPARRPLFVAAACATAAIGLAALGAVALLLLLVGFVAWRKGRPFAQGAVFRASRLSRGNRLLPVAADFTGLLMENGQAALDLNDCTRLRPEDQPQLEDLIPPHEIATP